MGDANEEEKAKNDLERVRTENAIKQMQRDEEMRKLREQQQKQGNMVADPSAGVGWPDNEVTSPGGPVTEVAGKLGIGRAGDLALARKLLDADRRPADAQPTSSRGDGAKARIGAALSRPATPAVER